MHIQQNNTMQKKFLQNPRKTQQKPKNQNFQKWVFANPACDILFNVGYLYFQIR